MNLQSSPPLDAAIVAVLVGAKPPPDRVAVLEQELSEYRKYVGTLLNRIERGNDARFVVEQRVSELEDVSRKQRERIEHAIAELKHPFQWQTPTIVRLREILGG